MLWKNDVLEILKNKSQLLKDCVHYIFRSSFGKSKGGHFWNKRKCCETRENLFYFTSKSLLFLEIIKFWLFRYSNVMTSSIVQAWNTKLILLNNLGSKHSLVIKFDQFIHITKEIFISKNSIKNETWKLFSCPF